MCDGLEYIKCHAYTEQKRQHTVTNIYTRTCNRIETIFCTFDACDFFRRFFSLCSALRCFFLFIYFVFSRCRARLRIVERAKSNEMNKHGWIVFFFFRFRFFCSFEAANILQTRDLATLFSLQVFLCLSVTMADEYKMWRRQRFQFSHSQTEPRGKEHPQRIENHIRTLCIRCCRFVFRFLLIYFLFSSCSVGIYALELTLGLNRFVLCQMWFHRMLRRFSFLVSVVIRLLRLELIHSLMICRVNWTHNNYFHIQ